MKAKEQADAPQVPAGSLGRLQKAILTLREGVEPYTGPQIVDALLAIAAAEPAGILQNDLRNGLSASVATMDRVLDQLSEGKPGGVAGLGLVEQYTPASDRRQRMLRLTRAGQDLVGRVRGILEGSV